MQVVKCLALAASASTLQQLHAPDPGAGGQHSAREIRQSRQGDGPFAQADGQAVQDDGQHTHAKSLSRAVCILDGPIQVHMLALSSFHGEWFKHGRKQSALDGVQSTSTKSLSFASWSAICLLDGCMQKYMPRVMFSAFGSGTA